MANFERTNGKYILDTLNDLAENKAGAPRVELHASEFQWMRTTIEGLVANVGRMEQKLEAAEAEAEALRHSPDDELVHHDYLANQQFGDFRIESVPGGSVITYDPDLPGPIATDTADEWMEAAEKHLVPALAKAWGSDDSDDDSDDELMEQVVHPNHYQRGGIETIDLLESVLSRDEFNGFLKGNILKYRERAGRKGGEDEEKDLAKAKFYYDLLQTKAYYQDNQ